MKKDSFFISLPVKTAAVILLTITTFIAAAGFLAVVYMADTGYYTGNFDSAVGSRYDDLMASYPERANDFKTAYAAESFMFANKNIIIIWMSVCILSAVVLFIYLMCTAGHRRGTGGIYLNFVDRMPLDIYAGIIVLIFILLISAATSFFYSINDIAQIIITVPFLAVMFLFALSFIMTIATRIKSGNLFRNTVIYRLLHLIYRIFLYICRKFLWFIRSLPVVWKSAAVYLIYMFISFILSVLLIHSMPAFLFWAAFNITVLYIICMISVQLGSLKEGGEKLAAGELTYKIPADRLFWDLRSHAENLNNIGEGMQRAVNERMKSEHFKAELITNVSHDIKTPLTSIINYVDLLKKEELNNESAAAYIEVLDRQSARLKKLTEDLVEASKASTGNIALNKEKTDIAEFIGQCIAEYGDRLTSSGLTAITALPEKPVFIEADGRLLWRIFDNLLGNICKYSLAGTRVYISADAADNAVRVTLRNISRESLNLTPDELMERFIRGDSSRNTDGSGLGLSIARSFTELQGGILSLDIDGDLFKVIIEFPRMHTNVHALVNN